VGRYIHYTRGKPGWIRGDQSLKMAGQLPKPVAVCRHVHLVVSRQALKSFDFFGLSQVSKVKLNIGIHGVNMGLQRKIHLCIVITAVHFKPSSPIEFELLPSFLRGKISLLF